MLRNSFEIKFNRQTGRTTICARYRLKRSLHVGEAMVTIAGYWNGTKHFDSL